MIKDHQMNEENIIIPEKKEITKKISALNKKKECGICLSSPAIMAVIPCGHQCMCSNCSKMLNDLCPICRSKIERICRIY